MEWVLKAFRAGSVHLNLNEVVVVSWSMEGCVNADQAVLSRRNGVWGNALAAVAVRGCEAHFNTNNNVIYNCIASENTI